MASARTRGLRGRECHVLEKESVWMAVLTMPLGKPSAAARASTDGRWRTFACDRVARHPRRDAPSTRTVGSARRLRSLRVPLPRGDRNEGCLPHSTAFVSALSCRASSPFSLPAVAACNCVPTSGTLDISLGDTTHFVRVVRPLSFYTLHRAWAPGRLHSNPSNGLCAATWSSGVPIFI